MGGVLTVAVVVAAHELSDRDNGGRALPAPSPSSVARTSSPTPTATRSRADQAGWLRHQASRVREPVGVSPPAVPTTAVSRATPGCRTPTR